MADRKNEINLKDFYTTIMKGGSLLLPHQFIVTFSGADLPDDMKSEPNSLDSITYYVKAAKVPKVDIKDAKIQFLSQQFDIPIGVTYPDSWDVEVLMTTGLRQYTSIYNWQELYADLKNNGGAQAGQSKAIPNIDAHVRLLDSTMQNILHDFTLVGVFPTKVPDLKMKYENAANPVPYSCTFCFQYMYEHSEGDPLQA